MNARHRPLGACEPLVCYQACILIVKLGSKTPAPPELIHNALNAALNTQVISILQAGLSSLEKNVEASKINTYNSGTIG